MDIRHPVHIIQSNIFNIIFNFQISYIFINEMIYRQVVDPVVSFCG